MPYIYIYIYIKYHRIPRSLLSTSVRTIRRFWLPAVRWPPFSRLHLPPPPNRTQMVKQQVSHKVWPFLHAEGDSLTSISIIRHWCS